MTLKTLHLGVGIVVVVIFLATGWYMRLQFPELYGGNETVRFLFRSNHIYVLCVGLVHVVLGLYLIREAEGRRRVFQTLGSVLCLLSCPLIISAFFLEPPHPESHRVITAYGLYAIFAGVMAHVLGAWPRKKDT